MDIQYVLNAYACASYINDYLNKKNNGVAKLLKDALADIRKGTVSLRNRLNSIGSCFIKASEVCAQEAAYHLLSMPLSNSSRSTIYINTSPEDNRTRMLKSNSVLQQMNMSSTEVFCNNMLVYYTERPDELSELCLADFCANYN
jgi:hypothetical protein